MTTPFKVYDLHPKTVETLERILAMQPFNIHMMRFTNVRSKAVLGGKIHNEDGVDLTDVTQHPCGTSYCVAGKLAAEDGYPKEFRDLDNAYGFFAHPEYITGYLKFDPDLVDFVFGAYWPDDLDQAKRRAKLVLLNNGQHDFSKHISIPEYGIIRMRDYKAFSSN